MALSKIITGSLTDSAVTTDKINNCAVTSVKIGSAAVTSTDISSDFITGQSEKSTAAADNDYTLIYDTTAGTLKKVQKSNLAPAAPTISSVSPTNIFSSAGSTNFTITGTGFTTGSTARLIGASGRILEFTTVVRSSTTSITATIAGSSLDVTPSQEPWGVQVTNGSGISAVLSSQINVDSSPTFVTASGSLGTITDSNRATTSYTIRATDPDSLGGITYEVITGSLPTGATLNVSTGVISGFSAVVSDTTSNFTIRAKDVSSNTSTRAFSITVLAPVRTSFTSSGTFSVPAGVTAVNVLVVAGGGGGGAGASGGGGAGGLIYRPGFPVTPGGTITVTVGCGGPAAAIHWPGPNTGGSGQDSVFGTLTAKGGGYGSGDTGGGQGGSGGSSGYSGKGQGTQPTQAGDSGTYGFGNPGGCGSGIGASIFAGGGDGAGAAAQSVPLPGSPSGSAGNGGIGKAYTIADGTTSVYYAGGGGGGFYRPGGTPGQGGQGGGGSSGPYGGPAQAGTANRGGGGAGGSGGGSNSGLTPGSGGVGGKGIVIVQY